MTALIDDLETILAAVLTVVAMVLTVILAVVPVVLSDGVSVKRSAGKKNEADDDVFNGSVHNNSWFVVVSSFVRGRVASLKTI